MTERKTRALYHEGSIDVSESVWVGDAEPCSLPTLTGDRKADVAIVGAGLTGGSLALHLAQAGADVTLIEANEPGWGASGRNAGHVVPYRDLDRALARLPDRGERFLNMLRDGGDFVFDLIRRHEIDCGAVQAGYLQAAHMNGLVSVAEKKAERWSALGFRIRYANREEVEKLTGSPRFHGGLFAESGGRINPFLFTRGMVEAADRVGASVFARSPAVSIDRESLKWRVRTPQGSVVADRVVVCTNGYTDALVPELEKAWCPLVAFAIATKPLPEEMRSSLLPTGAILSQFPAGSHPTLIDDRGRLVSSLLPSVVRPQDGQPPLVWLERWLHRMFPQTRDLELELDKYWTGMMAWSTDELPRLFEVAPGLMSLTCMSGEGNLIAPLLGRDLAEGLVEDRLGDLALPVQAPEVPRWRGQYHWPLRVVAIPLMKFAERFGLA